MARTLADGLRVQMVGAIPWLHVAAFVDELVTVAEGEVLDAMRRVAVDARLVAEPSGAVAVAAALAADRARESAPTEGAADRARESAPTKASGARECQWGVSDKQLYKSRRFLVVFAAVCEGPVRR